jgi:NAD(P)-dependent dehydrogenase (short-subunit alcohol dehydrogenase family)
LQIEGRVFLISGGASGLGAATARLLAEGGARVLLFDLNESAGNALADEIGEASRFVAGDVADETQVRAAVGAARDAFGRLDGAVSCAGIGAAMKTVSKGKAHPLEAFAGVVRVNLVGTFNVIRLVAEAIVASSEPEGADDERGVLVNTASIAAFDGQIGQAAYAASKGGIVGMTLPIARDLARSGIRVVTIAPGLFDTPLLAGLPREARESLERQIPFPSRLGRGEEYALLVRHIIENPMLNGEVIRLDGALRMAPR